MVYLLGRQMQFLSKLVIYTKKLFEALNVKNWAEF